MIPSSSSSRRQASLLRLAIVFAGPAGAWLAHLLVSYALVPSSCRLGTRLPLHTVTVLSLLAAGIPLAVGVRARSRQRASSAEASSTVIDAGVVQGAIFVGAIVLGWIAVIVVHPCR